MAITMAAMMVPSAAPFFIAYERDTRRLAAIAGAALIYLGFWAAIGFAVDVSMNAVMMPLTWQIAAAVLAVAALYSLTPWSRWARARCQEMAGSAARGNAFSEGSTYAACCVVCSAGIMAALVVLGMSDTLVIVLGGATMFLYKFGGWSDLALVLRRIR